MMLDLDIRKTLRSGQRRFELAVSAHSEAMRTVVHGPSGAGKSLLLKAIAGLVRPDAGHVRVGGRTLFDAAGGTDLPAQQRGAAYLFQDYALFPHLTVRQNVAFGLVRGWRNPARAHTDSSVEQWLDWLDLKAVAHQHPLDLSGGQKQRVALARALAPSPRMLLLDEPFAALDADLRRHMRALLSDLLDRLAIPMVLITHDSDDVDAFGDHLIHLKDGQRVMVPAIASASDAAVDRVPDSPAERKAP